jgi:hypothetical protein
MVGVAQARLGHVRTGPGTGRAAQMSGNGFAIPSTRDAFTEVA